MEEPDTASPAPILASLDAETARRFITEPHLVNECEFSELHTDAARILTGRNGDLFLNGLRSISAEVAIAFAEHSEWLDLSGLTELSVEVAEALAFHQGSLFLNGLKCISAESARALAGHQGNQLILDGMTDLSVEVAAALWEKGVVGLPSHFNRWAH